MRGLRRIELYERFDRGRDGFGENACLVELVDVRPRNTCLIGIGREDGRTVLWSDIRPLAIGGFEACRDALAS